MVSKASKSSGQEVAERVSAGGGSVAACLVLVLAAVAGCGAGGGGSQPVVPYSFSYFNCLPASAVEDGGNTLVYDLAPEAPALGEESVGGDSFDHYYAVQCIRLVTQLPGAVWAQMSQTTALQGRQSAEWSVDAAALRNQMAGLPLMKDAVLAGSWTYHPYNGLDIIITVKR